MYINNKMEESNINTLETSNLKVFKEQGEQLKKYQSKENN